jgi:hypothetical protein
MPNSRRERGLNSEMNSDQHFFFFPTNFVAFPTRKIGNFWGISFWASVYSRLILVFLWENFDKRIYIKI